MTEKESKYVPTGLMGPERMVFGSDSSGSGIQVRRQVTINGRKVDLRNRCNFDLMNAKIQDVEAVANSYLTQLRNKPIKAVRRACICQLQRVLLLRGPKLNRWLYGSICLWTGAGMPSDYFTAPMPESLRLSNGNGNVGNLSLSL